MMRFLWIISLNSLVEIRNKYQTLTVWSQLNCFYEVVLMGNNNSYFGQNEETYINQILCVLIRAASMMWFLWVISLHALTEIRNKYQILTVGSHLNCFHEVVLMNTHNPCFAQKQETNIKYGLWVLIANVPWGCLICNHYSCFWQKHENKITKFPTHWK